MDYIFGFVDRNGVTVENLKTVGESHTDLAGFVEVVREFPDSTIIDHFRVVEKYHSSEDTDGNAYDWYEIDHHYRVTDKTGQLVEQAAENVTNMENALCEQDAAMDERMSALEDALCELDAAVNK